MEQKDETHLKLLAWQYKLLQKKEYEQKNKDLINIGKEMSQILLKKKAKEE